jgi:hypothetical protein
VNSSDQVASGVSTSGLVNTVNPAPDAPPTPLECYVGARDLWVAKAQVGREAVHGQPVGAVAAREESSTLAATTVNVPLLVARVLTCAVDKPETEFISVPSRAIEPQIRIKTAPDGQFVHSQQNAHQHRA